MTQRNTMERAMEMAKRAVRQLSRTSRFGMLGAPAALNRRTGEPHKHTRANARNLKNHVNKGA